jgi:hypothetical protein
VLEWKNKQLRDRDGSRRRQCEWISLKHNFLRGVQFSAQLRENSTMREENLVGCLLLVVFLAFPRIALALLFLFSNYLERAYHGLLLPLLGFLFLPLTTLVYAWMANTRQPIAGINLLILIVAVVVDLGGVGGGEYHRRRRWQE